jgi:hypothetical protein
MSLYIVLDIPDTLFHMREHFDRLGGFRYAALVAGTVALCLLPLLL